MAETKMQVLRKSLNCLYIAVDKSVADDVFNNVNEAFKERDLAIEGLVKAAERGSQFIADPEEYIKLEQALLAYKKVSQ